MKRLAYIILALTLVTPLLAEKFTLKKPFNDKPIFNTLQFTAWTLIDLDTFCTYKSYWHYGLKEANPFWRDILDRPELVFTVDMIIKTSIIWGTSEIYKKNKKLAYFVIILVNVIQVYCVYNHVKAWQCKR